MTDQRTETQTETEEDGLYYKYRVFREPEGTDTHPVVMTAYYRVPSGDPSGYQPDPIRYAQEVTDFIFPLKPDSDHHARVALAAYAASVMEEKPRLAQDLYEVLSDLYDTGNEGENTL